VRERSAVDKLVFGKTERTFAKFTSKHFAFCKTSSGHAATMAADLDLPLRPGQEGASEGAPGARSVGRRHRTHASHDQHRQSCPRHQQKLHQPHTRPVFDTRPTMGRPVSEINIF